MRKHSRAECAASGSAAQAPLQIPPLPQGPPRPPPAPTNLHVAQRRRRPAGERARVGSLGSRLLCRAAQPRRTHQRCQRLCRGARHSGVRVIQGPAQQQRDVCAVQRVVPERHPLERRRGRLPFLLQLGGELGRQRHRPAVGHAARPWPGWPPGLLRAGAAPARAAAAGCCGPAGTPRARCSPRCCWPRLACVQEKRSRASTLGMPTDRCCLQAASHAASQAATSAQCLPPVVDHQV